MQSSNYYQPTPQQYMMQPSMMDDPAINNNNNNNGGGGGEEDDSDGSGIPDKKSGRRKIKIEYINDKSRRHITFSKRKAGIMKKAYELSTLTGTQVLLLVVSETGLVYTFTTPKLQPLVTKPEGKNLIQSCLNAPDPLETASTSTMDQHPTTRSSNNASTSPPMTNNNNYYSSSNNNNYVDDRKSFGSMVAANPPLVLNNTAPAAAASDHQQLSSNYSMAYPSYNNNTTSTSSATTGSSLYPSFSLPDNENRYWGNTMTGGNKRPDNNIKR